MKRIRRVKDPGAFLEATIRSFINKSPENSLKNEKNEKAWAEPIVGFSRGDDPLYQFYKENIGAFYWTPLEIFTKTFPQLRITSDQLTIISWVLPHTDATKSDNRKQTVYPSERWARARIYGEEVNDKLRKHVVETLQELGCEAVAPMLSPLWKWETSERYGFASTWSERHAAYASGLGTFGLCDGLITPARAKIKRFAITTIICVLVASIFGTVMVLAPPPDLIFPQVMDVFVTNTSNDAVPADVSGWLHTREWGATHRTYPGDDIAIFQVVTEGYRQITIVVRDVICADFTFGLSWSVTSGGSHIEHYLEKVTVSQDTDFFLITREVIGKGLMFYVSSGSAEVGMFYASYYMTT